MGELKDGRTVVPAAGTRVQLTTVSTPCSSVAITAETDNTGIIVIGGTTIVATLATRRGTPLNAGDTGCLSAREDQVDDLSEVWLDTTVSGDGVTYTYGDPS